MEYQASLTAGRGGAFEPLVAAWRDEREAARIVLLRELDSPGYVRLVEDYRVFVAPRARRSWRRRAR